MPFARVTISVFLCCQENTAQRTFGTSKTNHDGRAGNNGPNHHFELSLRWGACFPKGESKTSRTMKVGIEQKSIPYAIDSWIDRSSSNEYPNISLDPSWSRSYDGDLNWQDPTLLGRTLERTSSVETAPTYAALLCHTLGVGQKCLWIEELYNNVVLRALYI